MCVPPSGCLVCHCPSPNTPLLSLAQLRVLTLLCARLLGLINNVLYVIILSAALDLVGPSIPKGVVLLADVLPSFITKLVAPYFIHAITYEVRILVFVALSTSGMILVAVTPASQDGATVALKMVGVMLASLSSGGGELSFLGLTHYYGHFSLAAWGSGTGGAGLVGAAAYVIATTTLGLSVRTSLLAFSFLPVVMLVTFFFVLPLGPLRAQTRQAAYESVPAEDESDDEAEGATSSTLLEGQDGSGMARSFSSLSSKADTWSQFKQNFRRARSLFFP